MVELCPIGVVEYYKGSVIAGRDGLSASVMLGDGETSEPVNLNGTDDAPLISRVELCCPLRVKFPKLSEHGLSANALIFIAELLPQSAVPVVCGKVTARDE